MPVIPALWSFKDSLDFLLCGLWRMIPCKNKEQRGLGVGEGSGLLGWIWTLIPRTHLVEEGTWFLGVVNLLTDAVIWFLFPETSFSLHSFVLLEETLFIFSAYFYWVFFLSFLFSFFIFLFLYFLFFGQWALLEKKPTISQHATFKGTNCSRTVPGGQRALICFVWA